MESIGERLKKIRLEKGLSLEEANKKTNIHLTILKAIEEDSMINLNPIYIKGFIKIYCTYLGVDPQEFVPEHKATQNIAPKKEVKEKTQKIALPLARAPFKFPVKQIVTATVVIILLLALFRIVKFIAVKASNFSAKHARTVLVTKELFKAETKKSQAAGQQAHNEKIPATNVIHLSIRAKDNCFIQVKCDGKTQFYGTLKKGRSDSWKANNKIEFSLGNATAVEVEVNNRLINSLGRRGQSVKNIVISKDGLSISQMKSKVGILSLGCPRNLVDSESIVARLITKGYKIVNIDKADVAIVNTCAFIDDAKAESVDAILKLIELKENGKLKKVLVYGCLSQRYHDALPKELSEIDAFVGRVALDEGIERFALTPKHYAYLKICEGCINNCSFCVIHKIKGKFCSIGIHSLIEKVKELDSGNISELNIIGQDISGYGIDIYGKYKLADLIKNISRACRSIKWLRLLYLYPSRVDDNLLRVIKDDPKVCKYLDLPVQHINERILKLMNRDTSGGGILELIAKVRKMMPDAAIRTSIIVGFPSETDKEFKELLSFVKEARFDRLGAFMYSAEEGTPACDFKGQVPEKVKKERFSAIMALQQQISVENNTKFLGRTIDVLIDEKKKDYYLARSRFDAPEVDGLVYVTSSRVLKRGDIVKVKINDTMEYDLRGEVELSSRVGAV